MPKTKFKPVFGSLEKLTEQERQDYLLAACEHLQVPPELGLVRLTWMDSGDGSRNLLLSVLRGATDIIRERLKIDVDSLEEANGDGYVGWKVKGHNASGRHEIAVGAVSTKGLNGTAIANAVKTSQTQACRRMTLQFAGGGFLDETEVVEKTTNLASAAQPFAQIAQPAVQPNTEAGKDITKVETSVALPVVEPDNLTPGSTTAEKKQPRGRPRKNGISLDLPIQESAVQLPQPCVGIPECADQVPDEAASVVPEQAPMTPEPAILISSTGTEFLPSPVMISAGTKVTKEQEEEYKNRLRQYVNEILPPAGFFQSEKFGGRHKKMKLFIQALIPDVNIKNPTVEQWDTFFKFLDDKRVEIGDTKLVNLINEMIGDVNVFPQTAVTGS